MRRIIFVCCSLVAFAGLCGSGSDSLVAALASPAYFAAPGENGSFLLKHSVGCKPHGGEIDVPLNYADYYFLEKLVRSRKKGILD